LLAYLLATLTALTNASSNVLQRQANKKEPPELRFSVRMIWDLAHHKTWLVGSGAIVVSFLLQAAALNFGRLAAVQPIVILELPLTLIGASLFLKTAMQRREWLAAALLTAGVIALVTGLSADGGASHVGALTWIVGIGASVGVIAALVVAGRRFNGARRGALLGAATGVEFGLTAALMKAMTHALSSGIVSVLTSWSTYAMAAAGLGGMFLLQNALQAGRLVTAQPGITLLDPVTAILWGTLGFHERTNTGLLLVVAILGGVVMVAGAIMLSRSKALVEDSAENDPGAGDRTEAGSSADPTPRRDTQVP
jgi:drug/metabolite transporter (DMT)-like permease